jgi:acyl-CoA dehydrogenase
MIERKFQRQSFGKFLREHGSCREMIANSASDLEAARLLTLAFAEEIDRLGAQGARDKITMIKLTVPELTARVVDRAVQVSIIYANVCSRMCVAIICSNTLHAIR